MSKFKSARDAAFADMRAEGIVPNTQSNKQVQQFISFINGNNKNERITLC